MIFRKRISRGEPFCKRVSPGTPFPKTPMRLRRCAGVATGSLTRTRGDEAYFERSFAVGQGRFSCKRAPSKSLRSKRNNPLHKKRVPNDLLSAPADALAKDHDTLFWLRP